jgi:hypothetical protein
MRTYHKPIVQSLAFWEPDLHWLKVANTRLHESFSAISNEWQTFVARRVKEDLHLSEELAAAKVPEEIWLAYAQFWQKAVEDYRNECLTLGHLYAEFVAPGRTAAPPKPEGAYIRSKAA